MKRKGYSHEILSLLFKRDGEPSKMIMDVSKGKNLGSLRNNCQEEDYHIKQTDL